MALQPAPMMNAMAAAETAPQQPVLLVVEDEPDIGSLLEYVLGREEFRVQIARSGQEALERLQQERPDLIVLDLMLPDMSGLEILRQVRKTSGERPRVIILSARQDEADRVRGFELGADDYMIKPFSPRELVLRIRKTLKTAAPAQGGGPRSLSVGPIDIDLERHEVRIDGSVIHLTLTEFRLLADMVRNEGRVRTREKLMTEVWGYDSQAMSRTIDTHVRRLRSKLGTAAGWLTTVRGVGYRIKEPGTDR
jgi:two-component system phosphate regulon response regulator PhoB